MNAIEFIQNALPADHNIVCVISAPFGQDVVISRRDNDLDGKAVYSVWKHEVDGLKFEYTRHGASLREMVDGINHRVRYAVRSAFAFALGLGVRQPKDSDEDRAVRSWGCYHWGETPTEFDGAYEIVCSAPHAVTITCVEEADDGRIAVYAVSSRMDEERFFVGTGRNYSDAKNHLEMALDNVLNTWVYVD